MNDRRRWPPLRRCPPAPGERGASLPDFSGHRAAHVPRVLGPCEPFQRARSRPLADAVLLQHCGRRLRASGLRDRGGARLVLARRRPRPHADDAALPLERAAGTRSHRHDRLQGLLLSFPRDAVRAASPPHRAVERRQRDPVHGRAVRRPILRPRGRCRSGRSASLPTNSTGARTGIFSARTGARRSRWAGIPRMA